jgi:two-component system sensor histidine kinase HydH
MLDTVSGMQSEKTVVYKKMLKRILFLVGVGISLFLMWFAVSNYRASRKIAEENLQGFALSVTAAIENMAVRDPSLRSLSAFHPADIAFFAIIDNKGVCRFHSNADLIGTTAESDKYKRVLSSKTISEARVTLGTGEKAFEIYTPIYFSGETFVLRLILHTYQADAVVRRAQFNMAVLLALLAVGWFFGVVLFRFAVREERHRLEMARRERLAQMGEMGSTLAHEIRNPLAGIKGYAQIIEKRPQELRNKGFARRITVEVLRLESLVSDLLAYAGSNSFPMSSVDLQGVIIHAVSFVRHEAEQQHVTVISECPEGVRVSGNRDKLEQVFLNLMKNALQSMPEGGNLHVTANASGKNVIITVSDSGQGIRSEDLPRIFEPFFTTKARGTGLGLALCKKIVEEHKGEIRVESVPGKGTSVSIIIPRMQLKR